MFVSYAVIFMMRKQAIRIMVWPLAPNGKTFRMNGSARFALSERISLRRLNAKAAPDPGGSGAAFQMSHRPAVQHATFSHPKSRLAFGTSVTRHKSRLPESPAISYLLQKNLHKLPELAKIPITGAFRPSVLPYRPVKYHASEALHKFRFG